MTPLRYVVLGFVVVYADVEVGGLDLLLDPVGWVLVLVGLQRLLARHPVAVVPRNAAVVGLVVSVPLAVVSLGALADLAVETALQAMIFFTFCTAMVRIAAATPAGPVYARARWLELGAALLGIAALFGGAASAATLLLLVDLGVAAWAMYWTWTVSGTELDDLGDRERLPR